MLIQKTRRVYIQNILDKCNKNNDYLFISNNPLVTDNSLFDQNKWKYLKYKVRNFTSLSQRLAKSSRKLQ